MGWSMGPDCKNEVALNTQERNVLRKEYGSVTGQEKIRTNQELTDLYKSSDIYTTRSLEWLQCDYNVASCFHTGVLLGLFNPEEGGNHVPPKCQLTFFNGLHGISRSQWPHSLRQTVFTRSNIGITGSIPIQGMDVCVYFVSVLSCVCRGLAVGWSHIQGVLQTVLGENWSESKCFTDGLYSKVGAIGKEKETALYPRR
jgi:hypothetical protein